MSTPSDPKGLLHPLVQARRDRNLSQKQAAEEAGIGLNTLKRAERGDPVSLETCRRLSKLFGESDQELGLVKEQPAVAIWQVVSQPVRKAAPVIWTRSPSLPVVPGGLSKRELSAWLVVSGSHLVESGCFPEFLIDGFPLILKVVQKMPKMTRRQMILLGAAALVESAGGKVLLPAFEQEHISASDRYELTLALSESVTEGWKQFNHSSSEHILVLSQAQLFMVQQSHSHLSPAALPYLYSGVYRLIGAALFFQARYTEAQEAQKRSYITALESGDPWNMAQTLTWQAYGYQADQEHTLAVQTIEKALRLLTDQEGEMHLRLKGHLLALWAENASIVESDAAGEKLVEEKLSAAASLLEEIAPNEEFDHLHWLQISGNCALTQKKYKQATELFEQALVKLPPEWLMRQVVTRVPLALAYARNNERDESLNVARKTLLTLTALKSRSMNSQFASYVQELEQIFPGDPSVKKFVTEELRPHLSLLNTSNVE